MEAVIKKCTCNHTYQDEVYGSFMRVFNPLGKKDSKQPTGYRCSVCGAIIRV